MLSYAYNGNKNDVEVYCALQRLNEQHALDTFHFIDVNDFKNHFPSLDPDQKTFRQELFRDARNNRDLVGDIIVDMWRSANILVAIQANLANPTKKVFMGVLANLLEVNINIGGNPIPFVKRCLILYDVLIKGVDFNTSVDYHYHRINHATWQSIVEILASD